MYAWSFGNFLSLDYEYKLIYTADLVFHNIFTCPLNRIKENYAELFYLTFCTVLLKSGQLDFNCLGFSKTIFIKWEDLQKLEMIYRICGTQTQSSFSSLIWGFTEIRNKISVGSVSVRVRISLPEWCLPKLTWFRYLSKSQVGSSVPSSKVWDNILL